MNPAVSSSSSDDNAQGSSESTESADGQTLEQSRSSTSEQRNSSVITSASSGLSSEEALLDPAAVISRDAGRSGLLVSQFLAMNQATGEVDMNRAARRTVIPIPAHLLAGMTEEEVNSIMRDEDSTDEEEEVHCSDRGSRRQPVMRHSKNSEHDDEGSDSQENVGKAPADHMDEVDVFFKRQFDLYSSLIEFAQLARTCPQGVYCMPSYEDLTIWSGACFVRHGLYQGGLFRFRVYLPPSYPNGCPSVYFLKPVFPAHPLVNQLSGSVCLQPAFPGWEPGTHYISMVLEFIKQLFYSKDLFYVDPQKLEEDLQQPDPGLRLYDLATAKLFHENKGRLLEVCRTCAKEAAEQNTYCRGHEDDVVLFSKFETSKYRPVLNALRAVGKEDISTYEASEVFADWFLDSWLHSSGIIEALRAAGNAQAEKGDASKPANASSNTDDLGTATKQGVIDNPESEKRVSDNNNGSTGQ